MKTLKQILEVYSPKSADEKRFVKKHITVKTADVAGNGDDVYSGAKVKTIDRKATRKGYSTPDSEAVYEEEQLDELKKSTVASYIQKKFGKMSDEPVSKNQYGYAKKDAKGIRNAGLRMSGVKATQKEAVFNDTLHPAGAALLKHIKPEHHNKYKPHLTSDVFNGSYRDRTDVLNAAKKAGHLKEDIEQMDELKKSTLGSYVKKAAQDAEQATQKEEVEMNEVLKVSSGAGEWIKDFESSKNPKFAGKSKEQRKQQALAAYYSAKRAGKE